MFRKTLPLGLVVVTLTACDTTEPRAPTSIQIDEPAVTLEVGDTLTVEATVLDQRGEAFSTTPAGVEVVWSSADPQIATVQGGHVTAVGVGTTTISAGATGLDPAELQVTVEPRTYSADIGFSYSGERSGSFTIDSDFQIDPLLGFSSPNFAFSFYDDEYGSQDVYGERQRADERYDVVWFWGVGPPVTGPTTRSVDPGGVFVLGYSPLTDSAEAVYEITNGEVQFTGLADGNLAGTFTLQAVNVETGADLSITSGSFDVPLLRLDQVAAGRLQGSALPMPRRR